MYRREVAEGWARDNCARSSALSDQVRKRQQAEAELAAALEELALWRARALAAEARLRTAA